MAAPVLAQHTENTTWATQIRIHAAIADINPEKKERLTHHISFGREKKHPYRRPHTMLYLLMCHAYKCGPIAPLALANGVDDDADGRGRAKPRETLYPNALLSCSHSLARSLAVRFISYLCVRARVRQMADVTNYTFCRVTNFLGFLRFPESALRHIMRNRPFCIVDRTN